jgi:hypothetical protein
MIRATHASVAIAALMGLICAAPVSSHAADAKAELITREHQCLAAPTLDAEMECYDPSEGLVLYDANTPREFDGAKAVRANFAPAYDDIKSPKYDISEEHAEVAGKLGFT